MSFPKHSFANDEKISPSTGRLFPGRFFRPFLAGTRKGPAGGMPADRTAQSRRRHADAANSAAPSTIDTEWEYGSFDSIDVPLRMTAPGGWRRRVAHTVRRYRRGGCLSTRIRRLRLPVPSRIYCVPNFFDTLKSPVFITGLFGCFIQDMRQSRDQILSLIQRF